VFGSFVVRAVVEVLPVAVASGEFWIYRFPAKYPFVELVDDFVVDYRLEFPREVVDGLALVVINILFTFI